MADEKDTLRERITHAIALIITIPLIGVAVYVLIVGGEHSQELTFISGILGVIMGFYFGQRGVERMEIGRTKAEEERTRAYEAKITAEEDRKKAEEAKIKAEEERTRADEAKIKAEEEGKKADEATTEMDKIRRLTSKSMSSINAELEKYKGYVREEQWNKFKNNLPEDKRKLLPPWDTAEEDRTSEQKQFLYMFELNWEKPQVGEDQTGEVRDVGVRPPEGGKNEN